jgi:hypothetical protein
MENQTQNQSESTGSNDKSLKGRWKALAFWKKCFIVAVIIVGIGQFSNDKSGGTSSSSTTASSSHTCSYCGKSFDGSGYWNDISIGECTHADSWSTLSNYCSSKCCKEAHQR